MSLLPCKLWPGRRGYYRVFCATRIVAIVEVGNFEEDRQIPTTYVKLPTDTGIQRMEYRISGRIQVLGDQLGLRPAGMDLTGDA